MYQDKHVKLYNKSCTNMSEVGAETVQCVVTSPPYWGLRKYSGEQDLPEWGGAFGLEPTPELYVQHTIEILREIKRVLRKDGVVFWNVGDSYGGTKQGNTESIKNPNVVTDDFIKSTKGTFIKPKDLCLIPFRVAIAAQEDGWWVRSVIIWNKPTPMPESVTDRPTESHEYILMLTKNAKYYWDQEAVREPHITEFRPTRPETLHGKEPTPSGNSNNLTYNKMHPNGRNLRSVWSFPTQPFPEAHFAVYPEKLPEMCIKASTPEEGCCSNCGAPYQRITENKPMVIKKTDGYAEASGNRTATAGTMLEPNESKTLGWQPGCKCNAEKTQSIVLDPFAGAGTTLWVAKKLNRQAIGYELSEEYCTLIEKRIRQQVIVFT